MADTVVLHDHKIALVQCKSKSLTYPARIGADFNALRNDMDKAIADAFRQGLRAREFLQANELAQLAAGNLDLRIHMPQVNGLYVVCVTLMPLQALAGRLANTNPE